MWRLGRSGLEVGRLGLGTVNFGWVTPPEEAFAIMDRALDLGICLFDTADSYNVDRGDESSESLLGRWLRKSPGRRREVVLATKVFRRMGDGPNQSGLSARHIRQACDESLRRLGVDYIDLYQMHHVDRATPWDEVWQALEQLVAAGKILYVGSSNFAAWHLTRCHLEGERRQLFGLASEQSPYNLSQRMVELEVLPACGGLGLGFLAYSPLAGGVLAGDDRGGRRRRSDQTATVRRGLEDPLARFGELCREFGLGEAVASLAWVLHQQGVTAALVGPRTPRQLDELASALEVELDAEILARLDAIWPGPGGRAPEAYAW